MNQKANVNEAAHNDSSDLEAQQMSPEEFAAAATVTALSNHGRSAEVFLRGRSLGFADATGDAALAQVHQREVNNALHFHSPDGAIPGMQVALPSADALKSYPGLRLKFPTAAAKVDEAAATLESEMLGVSLEDILGAPSESSLDSMLQNAAEAVGYFDRLNVQWSHLHYGAHAERAEKQGLPGLSRLLSAAWQVQTRVLGASEDEAEAARDELREEFRN